jgi:hypothetical protein
MNDVVTVLVAGHRSDRLPDGVAKDKVFLKLELLLSLLRDAAKHKDATLRVLTGVAKGTDEQTARIAERLDLPLHLFAPGQPESLTSHQKRSERTVWLGASDTGMHGGEVFAIRDEIALSFADALVVVWDGESPHGLSGGTVRLAFRAALMMKPVVWLVATDSSVCTLERTRLNDPYRQKLNCSHPEPAWLKACFSSVDDMKLREMLDKVVNLALDPSSDRDEQDVQRRLDDYRAGATKHVHPIRAGHLNKAMEALFLAKISRLLEQFKAVIPAANWGPEKAGEDHPIAPMLLIEARFKTSDVEATVAAGRHRDATWLIYGASALAVFTAVAGEIGLWPGGHNAFWSIVELVLIAIIIGGFKLENRQRWHEKWIGHRFIAEQLRYALMCLPMLGVPRPFMEPAWQVKDGALCLASAELWIVQRTLITEGLPNSADNVAYVASADEVKVRLAEYVKRVIEYQKNYHQGKHKNMHEMHKRMDTLSIGLFGATVLAVLAHFAIHASWLLIFTAFFPALAAAVFGLMTKLEIRRIAGQSAEAERELAALVVPIEEGVSQPGWEGWLRVRELALKSSRIMSDENSQWQQLIRDQKAELPA